MGLLTLLSRRLGKNKSREDLLQSQQQVTPVQTTRPVTVNTSGTWTTLRPEARFSQVSFNQPNAINAAKEPPSPAFRKEGLGNDRPGSAHSFLSGKSDRPRILQRPKREARRPPVSFRKPSSLSLTQTSLVQPYQPQLGEDAIDVAPHREGRERAESINSLVKRQSKDLLEAVEEFRPLDFRSRVQAAGARDYGEDVADRNIRLSTTQSSPDLFSQFTSDKSLSSQAGRVNSRTKFINSINEQYDTPSRKAPPQTGFDRPELFSRRNKNRLSLNTYKPSGLVSSAVPTPRSAVTTPGHRGGMTPSDFDSSDAEPDVWSRQYHMSPTGSSFSSPRSPMTTRYLSQVYDQQPHYIDEKNSFPEEREFGDITPSTHPNPQQSALSDGQVSVKAGTRSSHGTFRSSLASSVTSRIPSMDFMPLGYPKLQGNPKTISNCLNDNYGAPAGRSQSLHSHRHTRSYSSGESHSQQRTKSLLTTPSGLENLVEVDGQTPQPRSSSVHDWARITPSSGSISSSSNGLYSAASGSMRPASRHTKSTSIDSIPRPPSSQSYLSASVGRSASGWSPSTTQSTVFNIDDYVSSDDDSFTTEKRPSGRGEEELLFKGSYGVTGAALPGLPESTVYACSPPVVGFRATRLMSPREPSEEDAEGESGDDNNAAGVPDIDDDRLSMHRGLLLRQVRGNPEDSPVCTFGKKPGRPQVRSIKKPTPSWLPSDDRAPSAKTTPSALSLRSSSSNKSMNEEMHPSCRGEKRLSALGTLHGRNLLDEIDSDGSKRATSKREPVTSPIKEEFDPAIAARLRKEVKTRQREAQAKSIREKRMTRAFGEIDEDVLAALKAKGEETIQKRGRTRVRGAKGQNVIVSE